MIKVCYPFVGDSIGGSHISSLTLIDFINNNYPDIKTNVLVFSANENFKKYLKDRNITYIELGLELHKYSKISILFDLFKSLSVAIKYLKEHEINIVHTNDLRMNLIFLIASKFVSTKQLWHQRTSMPKSIFGQKIYLMSDKLIIASDFILNQLRDSFSSDKVSRVYNPINSYLASEKELSIKVNLFKKDKYVLAFIANMTPQKNPKLFVKLAKHLTLNYPNQYEFLMIGSVDYQIKKSVDFYKKNGHLDSSFRILGFKKDISKYYRQIDYLIVPAKADGFGRTLIEAMRAGVIVIANNSGGHREIINDEINGMLVDEDNEKAYLSKILSINTNLGIFKKIVYNAHSDAIKKYTVEKHANSIRSIYLDIHER